MSTFVLAKKDEGLTRTILTFHRTEWFDANPNDDEKIQPAADPRTATAGMDRDPAMGEVTLLINTSDSAAWPIGTHYMASLEAFDAPPE